MHRDEKIQLFINREAIERDSSGAPSSRASNWARTFQSNPETPLQIGQNDALTVRRTDCMHEA